MDEYSVYIDTSDKAGPKWTKAGAYNNLVIKQIKFPKPVLFLWTIDYVNNATILTVSLHWNDQKINLDLTVANDAAFNKKNMLMQFDIMLKGHLKGRDFENHVLSQWENFIDSAPAPEAKALSFEPFTLKQNIGNELSRAANDLPGIREKVTFPCGKHDACASLKGEECHLMTAIIYLNDHCKWTREQIADWVESLDVDTTFKTPTKENENVEG